MNPEPTFEDWAMLRKVALVFTSAAAIASLAFMFVVGRRQKSAILILLFTVWVLSPFAAVLLGSSAISKRRAGFEQKVFAGLASVVSLVSVGIYASVALGPPRPQPASFFLLVPAASWVVIVIVIASSRLRNAAPKQ
jgi:hypothetical protein